MTDADASPAPAADAPGLGSTEAALRLQRDGENVIGLRRERAVWLDFALRLTHPLVAVLIVASLVAALLGDRVSFAFVAVVVLLSVTLDFVQERRAGRAVSALQRRVALSAMVWRDGRLQACPASGLVRGDVVELAAGNLIPADGRVLDARDLQVDQAALSGEAFAVSKRPAAAGDVPRADDSAAPWADEQALFMGTSVVSGSARMEVLATGDATQLGETARTLAGAPPATAFERGTRDFGLLLTRMTMALVLFVLLAAALQQRALLPSLMFAVALAVGLTPELLPMIVSVTLARGAVRLARQRVIVKRLSAIQDLGAMDLLATDKTGTLTEAAIRLERCTDLDGQPSALGFELAWLNSRHAAGLRNGLDEAVLQHATPQQAGDWRKLDERPFDFERRRVAVLLRRGDAKRLIVKGAPEDVVALCAQRLQGELVRPLDAQGRELALQRLRELGEQGLRVLAVACRDGDAGLEQGLGIDYEHDLVLAGLLAFADPPKAGVAQVLRELHGLGIAVKVITGDSEAVTRHLADALGLHVGGVLSGRQIAAMDATALQAAAARTTLFCRVTPAQKERVVLALKARGRCVGFMGDGINDATALRAADVGIGVDDAVDVAKQAADLVLLERDLAVLREGVLEGRRTFANVMKYITMATSSNFGNMASMAAASLAVPFLPMLPVQILLNNFLYDLSEVALPLDRVDRDALRRPQHWDMRHIRDFMIAFGGLSSLFDLLTFALLLVVLRAGEAAFQTAWFIESMATQVLVVFVIRTRAAAWKSRPSPWLTASACGIVALSWVLPFTALGAWFGFVPVPAQTMLILAAVTLAYLVSAEGLKRGFARWRHRPRVPTRR